MDKESRRQIVKKILDKVLPDRIGHRMIFNWRRAFSRLLPLGGGSFGNHVTLYWDGDEAFDAMTDAIDAAKHSVFLETYIFDPDQAGLLVRDALLRAAQRGCEVIILYDYLGSPWLKTKFFHELRKAGAQVFAFNPIWPWRRHGPLLYRDHRKILVVDWTTGFSGGMNIAGDYGGKKWGTGRFRDTTIRVQGPAAQDLAQIFLETLRETAGQDKKKPFEPPVFEDGVFVQALGANQKWTLRAIQKSMKVVLKRATNHCYFTSPYFLPYGPLRKEIIDAAKRGVDVRVLTAGLSDIPLMKMASQTVYGQFLKAGVRIFEMYGRTLHAKTATIDGIYASVGSFNLDHWSGGRNLEVNVAVADGVVAKELERHFEEDLKLAKEVKLEEWENRSFFLRLVHWLAYQLMRL